MDDNKWIFNDLINICRKQTLTVSTAGARKPRGFVHNAPSVALCYMYYGPEIKYKAELSNYGGIRRQKTEKSWPAD